MTRCPEADRLRWWWYAQATVLRGEPGDEWQMVEDRGKPGYQEALRRLREHIQKCTVCKNWRVQ